MPDGNRGTFDISSSGIAETIYHEKELLALDYYVEYADGTIEYVNGGSFLTNYNALILAYVVVVETVELHIASPNDVAVAWNYEYTINALLFVTKKQLFIDGNKRTSVIFANHILISNGAGLIVIPEDNVPEYKKLLIDYYETDRTEEIKRFLYNKCLTKL